MCHSRAVLVCLLVVAMNVSAQDSSPSPKASSTEEKHQALAALTQARTTLFPLRRKREARQLLARVAPLLAATGDAVGAQEVLTLLPSNERDTVQPLIVAAQVDSGQIAAAKETAAAISSEDSKAAALLLIAGGQAKAGEFGEALRTAALIPAGRVESVQALLEVAQQQKLDGKSDEASQILRRAATAAAGLGNSNSGDADCGLSALAEVANAQEGLGESTEAVKTLQLAQGRVQDADAGCRFGATRYLQENDSGKAEIFKTAISGFREKLNSSNDSLGNEEQNEEDSSSAEESTANSEVEPLFIQLQQQPSVQNQSSSLTREQAQARLDSLRSVKPLYLRVRAAMSTSQQMTDAGKADEAQEAIRIGLEAADTVQDQNLRDMMLQSKAHAKAVAKDWDGARATIEEIANEPHRTAALVDIAFSAAQDGHAQLALSWATAEASPLSEASVLVSIAEALLHRPQQTFFLH